MKRILLLALILFSAALADAHAYQIVDEITTEVGGLTRTVWTVQAGTDPLDKFKMYRVRKTYVGNQDHSIILAPPLPSGFQIYEGSIDGDYNNSLAAKLAHAKYEVWGFSQRVQDVAPGTCESNPANCAVFSGWGLEQLTDDAEYVRSQILTENSEEKPVIGGLSLGAVVGYAAVDRSPEAYSGVIGIDGGLWNADADGRAYSALFCQLLDGLLAGGIYFDGSVQGYQLLAMLAMTDPNGLTNFPGFPPGTTNQQAFLFVLTSSAPNPSSFRSGFTIVTGSPLENELNFADLGYLEVFGIQQTINYSATKTVRDIQCSIAGLDSTWTDNLAAFQGKIFVHEAGQGFGRINSDTAALATQAELTTLTFQQFGHIDAFFSEDRKGLLDKPLLKWLKEVF